MFQKYAPVVEWMLLSLAQGRPMAEVLYCWRRKMNIPMLQEYEREQVLPHLTNAVEQIKHFRATLPSRKPKIMLVDTGRLRGNTRSRAFAKPM